jgi:RNA polymerase sigma factor (sigma-70 family)
MAADTRELMYGRRQTLPADQVMVADEEVLVACPESFEVFYRREFRSMVGFAYALSGSRVAAEDLAQEAMIVAHRAWDRVGLYERPDAWVRRVVANLSVSLYRRRVAEARAVVRLAGHRQEVLPALEPEDEEFWKAVRSLPHQQRRAVALYYLEDMSIEGISEVLDCSPSTAKVHLFKGRRNLAARLGLEAGS